MFSTLDDMGVLGADALTAACGSPTLTALLVPPPLAPFSTFTAELRLGVAALAGGFRGLGDAFDEGTAATTAVGVPSPS